MKTLDALVYPSEVKTIAVAEDEQYSGAHLYSIRHCNGFIEGKTEYSENNGTWLQFVHKADDGTITPGLQSEQLALVLLDRQEKLNARFPSEFNEKAVAGLRMFLEAQRERVEDRLNRGVMGELKK